MTDSPPVPFDELYAQRPWVRALALRLVRDPGAADDVEQQTWIAALEHPPRRGGVRAWLGTVVRNKAWKLRRSRERRARHEEVAPPAPPRERPPEEVLAAAEAHLRLVNAVMELDEPYRSTVLLRFFEDVAPSEIARRTGVPSETVKTRLRRAVEILRARLDGEFADRRAWAVPILGLDAFREATREGTGAGVSLAPMATGVAVMTANKLTLGVAAAVLMAMAGIWTLASGRETQTPAGSKDVAVAPTEASVRPRTEREPHRLSEDPSTVPATATVPIPREIDRARDLHGEVVSTDGSPIADAALRVETVLSVTSPIGTATVATATTGADGRFAFPLTPGAIVNVAAEAPGHARILASGLQPGEHLRIVLPKAMRLVVSVRGSDGGPAVGVALRLTAVVNPLTTTLQLANQEASTDASGTAVFQSLAAGADVRVNAWPAERDAPGSATLTLPAKDEASMTISLTRGADLRGRVYDARNGQGIAAARVTLSTGIGSDRAVSTAQDGTFQITGDDATRSSLLRVTAPGFVATSMEASASKFVEAPLRAAVPVTARVVDASGAPIAGALVTLVANSGEGTRTDADGRVHLDGFADDARGLVVVSVPGLATANVNLVPQPGVRERDLGDIRLSAGAEVAGVVLTTDGKPAARAAVWLLAIGGGMRFSDDLGRFRFPNVAAGDGRIGAADGGQPSRFQTVRVVEGQPLAVTLVIEARRDLRIEVVDDAGRPIQGLEFMVQSMDQQTTKAITGVDGAARALVTGRGNVRFVDRGARFVCDPQGRVVRPSQDVVRFVAVAAAHATGVIVGNDGQPIAGAQFDVRSGARFLGRLRADAQGRFDVLVPVGVPASVELVAQPVAGKQLDDKMLGGRIEFTAGITDLTLRAVPVASNGALTIRVVSPDGAPVAGARVVANGPISHFDATSDAEGRAQLSGLPVRELAVLALATGGWQTSVPQPVTPAGQEITLTLRVASSVAGRVVDADGRPVARVAVVVEDATGSERRNGTTDADGRFRVEFPADIAAPLAINAQRASMESIQDAWIENVAPGAIDLEIVLR